MRHESNLPAKDAAVEPAEELDPAAIEAYLNSGYDKHIKQARNALFIIAGVQVISGIVSSVQAQGDVLTAIWIEVLLVAGIFTGLAFWTSKKPYLAILVGLIFYLAYQALLGIITPVSIFQGIIFKIFIVVYLIKGLNDAKAE